MEESLSKGANFFIPGWPWRSAERQEKQLQSQCEQEERAGGAAGGRKRAVTHNRVPHVGKDIEQVTALKLEASELYEHHAEPPKTVPCTDRPELRIPTETTRETLAKRFNGRTKSKIDFKDGKHLKNDRISSDGNAQRAAL